MKEHVNFFTSASTAMGAIITPDAILSWGQKILLGVLVGVLTSLTMRLFDKLVGRNKK